MLSGMLSPSVRRVFLIEINYQCECALHSASSIQALLDDLKVSDTVLVFHFLHSLVSSAALVARIAWSQYEDGRHGTRRGERKQLRDELGINEHSPISLAHRTVRNKVEHIDEYIEDWAKQQPKTSMYIDRIIAPRSTRLISGSAASSLTTQDVFRQYDQTTGTYYFWQFEVNVKELIDDIVRVRDRSSVLIEHSASKV